MQQPHLLLFLFLPILLPGMWADPEAEPQVIQYLLTSLFANISSAEVSCVALVGDIAILTLDPANWSIHFHWPWVSQAAAEDDGEKMMSQYKIALRNMIRFVHDTVQQTKQHYPLVVQFRAGCVLYPNTTSQGFLNVGWDGRDLVAFEVDKQGWEARQPSQVAELVSKSLNRQKSLRILLEHLLSIWVCQSNFLTLKRYGKEILERQELPVATVFARTPSLDQLLLVCHVTGFYPRPISVAWLRDGQEVPPGPVLNTSTILPNADLTYQLRSVLAVAPRDGHSYVCRVRHHSLGTRSLLIPWENRSAAPTISITIAVLLLVATAFAGGFWWWKRRKGNEATWETQEFII
ncbi:T-cell surface glycoprotein CD1b-3-like isoform X1 [Agelaius tricolor]|uniref:T-cell surface glycoprotein CD1b-3-like isoform X1 n=1 Tax=Agelaius tricolor TaxID=9191 RepID=UPI0039F1AAFC